MKKNIWQPIGALIGIIAGLISIITTTVAFWDDIKKISSIGIKVLLILTCLLIVSFLVALWMKFVEHYMPLFPKKERKLKKSLEESLLECKDICGKYSKSLKKIETYNKTAENVKDLIFQLALEGEYYTFNMKKPDDDHENFRYIKKLKELEGNEELKQGEMPINKDVYVITNDMCLDIHSRIFNEVIEGNIEKTKLKANKKYITTYKYLIPRGVSVEVPKNLLKQFRDVFGNTKDNDKNYPELSLPDIYRFKYHDELIYEKEEDEVERDKQFYEWARKRSELFLEVDPEIFKIFGPSPERTIYFHQLDKKVDVSLFVKSKPYSPSSGEEFVELAMYTIILERNHEVIQEIKSIIGGFNGYWNKLKNANFNYPILKILDVPFTLEEKAEEIWVLTPDLVFDNTFVPIRNIVKRKLRSHLDPMKPREKINYKFIIPYPNPNEKIEKHLNVFFKIHGIIDEENAIDEEAINKILKNSFFFVSSEALSQFSIFGEISFYKNVTIDHNKSKLKQNVLCLFPPVSNNMFGGFNMEEGTEVETKELVKEFGRDKGVVNYADFALILDKAFTEGFYRHMKIIIDPERKQKKEVEYYECRYVNGEFIFPDT